MMDSLILHFISDEEIEKRNKKHEIWRQKQLDIFYRTGKPIYNVTLETQHIRRNRNPHHFIEKNVWDN
jgi:hypothetical protein